MPTFDNMINYLPSNSIPLVTSHFININLFLEDDLYLISNSRIALFPISSLISIKDTYKKR